MGNARRVARHLQRPRLRLAADRGALPACGSGRAGPCRPPGPPAVRPTRVPPPHGGRAAAHRRRRAAGRQPDRRCRGLGDPRHLPGRAPRGARGAARRGRVHNEKDVCSLGSCCHVEGVRQRNSGTGPARGPCGLARAYGRERRHAEALDCLDDALAAPAPVRDPFGRSPVGPARDREAREDERDAWWAPRHRPHFGGVRPRSGWRGPLAGDRDGPLGPPPVAAAWEAPPVDRRGLAAERGRVLRRLGVGRGREAWLSAAAGGGGLGAGGWIEVAKMREHGSPIRRGARATRAAWRLLDREGMLGRPHPLEADLRDAAGSRTDRVASRPQR